MIEEMNTLEKNGTWELVDLPSGKDTVGWKWVFTVKLKPNDTIDRYKAWLFTKGYTQTYGIDYQETFTSVAKMNSVWILILMVMNKWWPLLQLDVKNAFLHGDLKEEMYMKLPPDF